MSEEAKKQDLKAIKSKKVHNALELVYTSCGYGYIEIMSNAQQNERVLTEDEKAQLPEMNTVKLINGASLSLHVSIVNIGLFVRKA